MPDATLPSSVNQFYATVGDINGRALRVYEHLLAAAEICNPAAPPFKNLTIVFFHVLQRFFTAYLYRTTEHANGLCTPELLGATNLDFPYWDYQNIRQGLDVSTCRYPVFPQANRWGMRRIARAASAVSGISGRRGKRIAIFPTFLNASRLATSLLRKGHRLVFPDISGISGIAMSEQWPFLVSALRPLMNELNMTTLVQESAIKLLHNYMQACITEECKASGWDIAVTGSMLTIEYRLMGAEARSRGLPLFVPIHGDADGFLDEPWSGYGEATYPTHLLSFGNHGDDLRRNSRYARSLLGEIPQSIPTSSPFIIGKLWSPDREIRRADNISANRILYIPTSYPLFQSYGPFHSAPDFLYRQWQQALCTAFPNLTIKEHPTNIDSGQTVPCPAPKDFRPLEEAILDYDAYILDYISTGLNLALATDKPVIYFDIGIRNPTAAASAAISQRCIYVRPDSFDPRAIRKSVLEQIDLEKSDAFTPEFSVGTSRRSREEIFSNVLDSL
ncbi:MAG: hypothetical protein V4527_14610 [Pseudomonadota bacterium]